MMQKQQQYNIIIQIYTIAAEITGALCEGGDNNKNTINSLWL